MSPTLTPGLRIPAAGFDEWYLFEELPSAFTPEVFVNFVPFPLGCDPEDSDSNTRAHRLWRQLESLRPITYVAQAYRDAVVSSNIEFIRDIVALS